MNHDHLFARDGHLTMLSLDRYDVGELDALFPGLRLADDEPLYTRP